MHKEHEIRTYELEAFAGLFAKVAAKSTALLLPLSARLKLGGVTILDLCTW